MSSDDRSLHFPQGQTPTVIGKYTSQRAIECDRPEPQTAEQLRARDKAARRDRKEQSSAARDENFKMRVFWITFAALVVIDYLYLPAILPNTSLSWWGHTALVVFATFFCVILLKQLRLLRTLRRIVSASAILAIALGAFVLVDYFSRTY